jgi:tRNA(adenine34) deaminase
VTDDEVFMAQALIAAEDARKLGEVPIGAVVVDSAGNTLAVEGNRTISQLDPSAHAEILALRAAARRVGNYRLAGVTVYTTIEPCVMCAGALVNARVTRIVYGAADERFGAVRTIFNVCDDPRLNHRINITSGVLDDRCKALMQDFFRERRSGGSSGP